ncbi:MAG TPA: DUF1552 domain-containing protein [Polyangia bacterium]|jgi:hypothetical protein
MVIFYTHNGCLTDKWFPKVTNGALAASDLTSTTLAPLAPYVKKLLIPRGFRSMNAYGQGQSIDPHDQACGSKLTCAPIDSANKRYATATSLDHIVAKQINPGGGAPLVLSVGAASTNIKEIISFSAPGAAFPATVNPTTVYNALTGVFGTGTPAAPATAADWHVTRGQRAADLVSGDLKRFQALKMSGDDQKRIQDWLDLLQTVENGMGMTGVPGSCTKSTAEASPFSATSANVTAGSPSGVISGGVFGGNNSTTGASNLATSFTLGGDLMLQLMALNMICDVNRVFIMLYPGYVTFNWDGIMDKNDHHGLSHRTGDLTVGGNCGQSGGVMNVIDLIGQIDNWYAGKFAKLVGLLDSVGEGSGTLLDNTATMWLPELSDGAAHNLNNLPIVLAGGAGGYLKMGGNVVNVDTGTPDAGKSTSTCADGSTGAIGYTGSNGGNVPINKLYVTLMNAVGCTADGTASGGKVTTFGVMDGTGATAGISNPGEVSKLTATG